MDIETLRMIERIIIVLFAGVSIFFGWNLFKIGVVQESTGTFEGKGYKVIIQKAGPGIFFSMFGTIILVIALIFGLNKSETTSRDQNNGSSKTIVLFNDSNGKFDNKKIVASINSLSLIEPNIIPYSTNKIAYEQAVQNLKNYRDLILINVFGKEELRKYESCLKQKDGKCENTQKYMEIHSWKNEDLL